MNGRATLARVMAVLVLIAAPAQGQGQVRNRVGLDELGVRSSLFETYVRPGQLLIYPHGAYSTDHNLDYTPADLDYGADTNALQGRFHSTEAQVFVAYGVTEWLALEAEGSQISATFHRSARDTSAVPTRIHESGLSDWAVQARMRVARQRGAWPQVFAAFELTPPMHKTTRLIGDRQWNLKGEVGLARDYGWGTLSARTVIEWNRGDHHWDLGETSLEYLRQVSSAGRLLFAIEGGEGGALDEWTFVSAGRWRVARGVDIKFANAFGLQSKSTDWETQLGLMFTLIGR
jgi:hypothetical protein